MRCATWKERVVGVLHDVIEDCGLLTFDLREAGIDAECVAAVLAVSRMDGEKYADFIELGLAIP